jgi:hypothetical protein
MSEITDAEVRAEFEKWRERYEHEGHKTGRALNPTSFEAWQAGVKHGMERAVGIAKLDAASYREIADSDLVTPEGRDLHDAMWAGASNVENAIRKAIP